MPVYYPALIAGDPRYCSDTTGNYRVAPKSPSRYTNAYPRGYQIQDPAHADLATITLPSARRTTLRGTTPTGK